MDKTAKFWDRLATRYSNQPVPDEAIYQKKLKITQEYLRPDMNVLEFGCGTGSTAVVHAAHVSHLQAIDMSSKMLDIAQSKAEDLKLDNITFQHATIDEFEAPDESFDVVLGLSVLHLLEDKESAMKKSFQLLKPGGVFVSSTACLADGLGFLKYIAPVGRFFGLLPIVKVFTAKDMKASVTAAGFEIEQEWEPGKNKGVFIVGRKGG
ncbi:SAM-dependent methyltransferase [Gammaproteobacteria bacterium 45_16_T64]|nr:SAM-dependent methyltransferase [Gammaproteobacteria bacterium 45_16_T64]